MSQVRSLGARLSEGHGCCPWRSQGNSGTTLTTHRDRLRRPCTQKIHVSKDPRDYGHRIRFQKQTVVPTLCCAGSTESTSSSCLDSRSLIMSLAHETEVAAYGKAETKTKSPCRPTPLTRAPKAQPTAPAESKAAEPDRAIVVQPSTLYPMAKVRATATDRATGNIRIVFDRATSPLIDQVDFWVLLVPCNCPLPVYCPHLLYSLALFERFDVRCDPSGASVRVGRRETADSVGAVGSWRFGGGAPPDVHLLWSAGCAGTRSRRAARQRCPLPQVPAVASHSARGLCPLATGGRGGHSLYCVKSCHSFVS